MPIAAFEKYPFGVNVQSKHKWGLVNHVHTVCMRDRSL